MSFFFFQTLVFRKKNLDLWKDSWENQINKTNRWIMIAHFGPITRYRNVYLTYFSFQYRYTLCLSQRLKYPLGDTKLGNLVATSQNCFKPESGGLYCTQMFK